MKVLWDYFKKNKWEIISVLVILSLGLFLRIVTINNYGSLYHDEDYSWYFASLKNCFDTIKELIKVDVHMPLYFIILHFWIKIFPQVPESLHYCSIFLSIAVIPLSFYLTKKYFNIYAAYFSSILLALNTFCIYYSVYARFYALVLPLSLIFAFAFLKFIENSNNKNMVLFIVIHSLLFYTFHLSLIMSFFYALAGLFYLFYKKKNIKKFLTAYLIIALISAPGIIFILYNLITLSTNLISHSEEFFRFSNYAIYDVLENFFANENYQIIFKNPDAYRDLLNNLFNINYCIFVFIPILISLYAIIKCLFSKNLKLYLFLIPCLLTIATVILLGKFDIIYYQTKYLIIIFPAIVVSCAVGLSLIKDKLVAIIVFAVLITINSIYTFTSTLTSSTVLNHFSVEISDLMTPMEYEFHLQDDDLLIIPFVPNIIKMYISKGKLIPFSFDEGLLLKDKKSIKFYFGDELYPKLNKDNINDIIAKEVIDKKIHEAYENNLFEKYIKNMKTGQKLIIVNPFEVNTGDVKILEYYTPKDCKERKGFIFITSKVYLDTIKIAEKYLKSFNEYHNVENGYAIYGYIK